MIKKTVISIFIGFLCLSSLLVKAHPRTDEIIGNGDATKYINASFENPNFVVAFLVRTGEITGWSVPDESENVTEEELYYILIDCAEKIFGKDTERYEVNKEKFMNMIEEMKEAS